MGVINWTSGQLITIGEGDTAVCNGGLNRGQIYGLFFYNAQGNDASTTVNVVWSNSERPVQLEVPGTTGNKGLASICFVNGNDTSTVSISVIHGNPGAKIDAFIGSVKMPVNTRGINNRSLPLNGYPQPFDKFTRYYTVPESHWYSARLQSNINQFMCVQFREHDATVYTVNKLVDPPKLISYCGTAEKYVTLEMSDTQSISWSLQGNGTQSVWINADSVQDSEDATITVQSLAANFSHLG